MIVVDEKMARVSFFVFVLFQAWIGAAFSLGFIFGPLLGASCSQLGTILWPKSSVIFFVFPAGVSLLLSMINIAFINQCCPETLPISKRVFQNEEFSSID